MSSPLVLFIGQAVIGLPMFALMQQVDDNTPPGNPVVGDDRPADFEAVSQTNYALWAFIGVCLIVAGYLLVRIERWERQRRG